MTDTLFPSALIAPLFSSAAMRAVVDDRARLQRMLDFEAALARAEAAVGVIPVSAAGDIGDACRATRYDIEALAEAAARTGNVAVPLIAALTAEVGKRSTQSAGYVHWGAASQDAIDTALVLELRAAIDALLVDLDRATKAFTALAGRHRRSYTIARTALQQSLPMPFGLKVAGYAAALARSRERLRRLRREALALQFGGTAGTLAALGDNGLDVSERLAALLDLPHPDAPWQSHRDRLAEIASSFAILAGSCGKIARDVALLMQNEIAEASERQRDPVAASAVLAAASLAPQLAATILTAQAQEHERGVSGPEWANFAMLALATSGALQAVVDIAEGLEVDVERMKANLEASSGQVFAEAVVYAIAGRLGRVTAHELVAELARKAAAEKRPLRETLAADQRISAQLDEAALERLFRPTNYLGAAQTFIDRLVASSQGRLVRRPTEIKPRMPEPKPSAAPAEMIRPVVEPAAVLAPTQPEPTAAPLAVATAEAKPVEAPAAELPPVPPAEPPSALLEAFNRVAEAAGQMASSPDRERKPE
jgi:3-carboxy-cis,cis-muconate cycloisomerase